MAGIGPKWLMVPDVICDSLINVDHTKVLRYPGIKEDVYVPNFRPTPGIREQLGLSRDALVVTIRPPASDAHYHDPQSDQLFQAVVESVTETDAVQVVVLPRNKHQAALLERLWPSLFAAGKLRIPETVVDGLNLMWFSDVVISAGGTMNREAAALGVPVYSIFRGKSAAVDRYLAATGRLVLLQHADDVKKIRLIRRQPTTNPNFSTRPALAEIVRNVSALLDGTSAVLR